MDHWKTLFTRDELNRIMSSTFVRHIEFHRELSSTNDLALQLAEQQDLATPVLVLAENQTAGRGRGTNRWWSSCGALTFSLIVETMASRLGPDRWPLVSLKIGLASCKTLKSLVPQAEIALKWPNDVFLAGRKVCGVLVEAPARTRNILILGIGVNVNNSFAIAPPELRSTATSMFDVTGQTFHLPDVLIGLLHNIEAILARVDVDTGPVAEWSRYCMLTGRTVHLHRHAQRTIGICRGIDHQGALVLQNEHGTTKHFAGVVVRFE